MKALLAGPSPISPMKAEITPRPRVRHPDAAAEVESLSSVGSQSTITLPLTPHHTVSITACAAFRAFSLTSLSSVITWHARLATQAR